MPRRRRARGWPGRSGGKLAATWHYRICTRPAVTGMGLTVGRSDETVHGDQPQQLTTTATVSGAVKPSQRIEDKQR